MVPPCKKLPGVVIRKAWVGLKQAWLPNERKGTPLVTSLDVQSQAMLASVAAEFVKSRKFPLYKYATSKRLHLTEQCCRGLGRHRAYRTTSCSMMVPCDATTMWNVGSHEKLSIFKSTRIYLHNLSRLRIEHIDLFTNRTTVDRSAGTLVDISWI